MRTSVIAAIIAAALTTVAHSQETGKGNAKQRHFNIINCSALKGQPQVCLFNENDDQVTDIDCETSGFFGGKGTKAVDIPRGGIPAHSITIIPFKSCKTSLIFTMSGGEQRRVDKVDTDNMTVITVPQPQK